MKLLCLIDNLGSGGAQRQLVNLAILWKQRGHEIVFVCYGDADFFEPQLTKNGIDINRINNKNALDRIVKVRRFLKKCDSDIVISFLLTPNFLGCISAIGKHRWKLVTNELSAKEKSFTEPRAKIFKWFEHFSDWTVCNSYNAKQMWEKYYPQFANRISTIYNPVIIPQIQSEDRMCNDKRRRIVVAASYQYIKNPINVIKAVSELSKEQQSRLRIDWYGRKEVTAGNTQIADRAVQLIVRYGLEKCIYLHDETHTIYEEMKNSDAVGLFSYYEGLPNAICEGMMIGKPIIMTKMSDYTNLVGKDNGFLCEAVDIRSIKYAIMDFLNASESTLRNMGISSRAKAISLFSADMIVEQWESLFKRLKAMKE